MYKVYDMRSGLHLIMEAKDIMDRNMDEGFHLWVEGYVSTKGKLPTMERTIQMLNKETVNG